MHLIINNVTYVVQVRFIIPRFNNTTQGVFQSNQVISYITLKRTQVLFLVIFYHDELMIAGNLALYEVRVSLYIHLR